MRSKCGRSCTGARPRTRGYSSARIDAGRNGVTRRVAARDIERGGGDIGGEYSRLGEFVRQSYGDAARTGADVSNEHGLRAKFLRGQSSEHCFDEVLGFGPRNQYGGRDLEVQPPELLMADEILRWGASGALLNQVRIGSLLLGAEGSVRDERKSRRDRGQGGA